MNSNSDVQRTVPIRNLRIDDVARNARSEALRMRGTDSMHAAPAPCTIQLEADEPDEELSHLQADGFWGSEKGFHDAEQLSGK